MKQVFVFEFCFDDGVFRYVLPIEGFNTDDDEIFETIQNEIDNRELEEKFGVHDFSTAYNTKYEEVVGYTTYEVPKVKIEDLLKEWYDILSNVLNLKVGNWETEYLKKQI